MLTKKIALGKIALGVIVVILPIVLFYMAFTPTTIDYNLDKLKLKMISEPDLKITNPVFPLETLKFKKKIEAYISTHPDVGPRIEEAMRNLTIIKGMNQDEVVILIGTPDEKMKEKGFATIWETTHNEVWLYYELDFFKPWRRSVMAGIDCGRFTFTDGILTKIEEERIIHHAI